MLFLIEYDRSRGSVVSLERFDNESRVAAQNARLELEIRLVNSGVQHEVVLLEASDESALRKTHRRYFENLADLSKKSNR